MAILKCFTLGTACFALAETARAQSDQGPSPPTAPAAGIETIVSTDSEKTDVKKAIGKAYWQFEGPGEYGGISIEHVTYRFRDGPNRNEKRFYLQLARSSKDWAWHARIGANRDTVLGAGSIRAADWSKELFIERERVETPRGVSDGLYYTLLGASADILSAPRHVLNGMIGVQQFTGDNERILLRGSYIHVLAPSLGISAQLRTRYFHSTSPGEFDYFSPRDHVQLLPVVQMRRFDRNGWMYMAAFGFGAQRSTGSGWERSKLIDAKIESPASARKFQFFIHAQYTNSSLAGAASGYNYVTARAGAVARF